MQTVRKNELKLNNYTMPHFAVFLKLRNKKAGINCNNYVSSTKC